MPNQHYPPDPLRRAMVPEAAGNPSPVISYFHGIFIRMRLDDTRPCFHAAYGESTAVFDLGGNILEGEFPEKQRMYAAVWADIHRAELGVLWDLMRRESAYFTIRGLN